MVEIVSFLIFGLVLVNNGDIQCELFKKVYQCMRVIDIIIGEYLDIFVFYINVIESLRVDIGFYKGGKVVGFVFIVVEVVVGVLEKKKQLYIIYVVVVKVNVVKGFLEEKFVIFDFKILDYVGKVVVVEFKCSDMEIKFDRVSKKLELMGSIFGYEKFQKKVKWYCDDYKSFV